MNVPVKRNYIIIPHDNQVENHERACKRHYIIIPHVIQVEKHERACEKTLYYNTTRQSGRGIRT